MSWNQIINGGAANNFACCGVDFNDRTILGGYGGGQIVSVSPLTVEANSTGEAVLDMCVFKGNVFATSENNSDSTRVLVRQANGTWAPVGLGGYAAYFMCVWGDRMIVTTAPVGGPDYPYIDVWITSDGFNYTKIARLSDWLWRPVVYNGDLYLIGKSGNASTGSGSKAVKWNGSGFETVGILTGTCTEWQCGYQFDKYLLLGGGGWTVDRGDPGLGTIFLYDGNGVATLKNVPGYSECSAITDVDGVLYAAFASGFKYDGRPEVYRTTGNSQIWASSNNGGTWALSQTFDMPMLYVLLPTDRGLVAAGGWNGVTAAFIDEQKQDIEELKPPTEVSVSQYDHDRLQVTWTASVSKSANAYEVEVRYGFGDTATKWRPMGTVSHSPLLFTPIAVGKIQARVRALITPRRGKPGIPTQPTEVTYSDWSETSPIYNIYPDYSLNPPEYLDIFLSMDPAGEVKLYWTACTQNPLAQTVLEYFDVRDGIAKQMTRVSGALTTYTWNGGIPGTTYMFYAWYYVPGTTIRSTKIPSNTYATIPSSFAAPERLNVSFLTKTSIQLAWDDRAVGEAVYEIERRNLPVGGWHLLVNLPKNTTSFTDKSVNLSGYYQYRVRARSGNIVSLWVESQALPTIPRAFYIQYTDFDDVTKIATISMTQSWIKYHDYPAYIGIQLSTDGTNFENVRLDYGDWTNPQEFTLELPRLITYYIRFFAANGAGVVYSGVVSVNTIPQFFTTANPPTYEPGTSLNKSVVWSKDGAGEAMFALTGIARWDGYPYAATTSSVNLLDLEPTDAEIVMMPVGDEWFGEPTIYGVDLEASTHRDVLVSIGARNSYKEPNFDTGKEVSIYKRGKTGYLKNGREFEVKFRWTSGIPNHLRIYGGRLWLKLASRRGLNTIPYFFGKKGYDPKKGA